METNSARERPQSAVEKAGAWKPGKTKNRFPPAPTLPWKSRPNREIPTFPPRRRRLLFSQKEKQKPNPKPRRRPNGRVALFHKADRSHNNKTGQLDLLPTGRYNLGLSSIVELTQAQLNLTEAEVESLGAKYEFQKSYAVLRYSTGMLR